LANGRVAPCCLDCDDIIELGNLDKESLENILSGKRAINMLKGFNENKAIEELCQKYGYKERFTQ